MWTKSKFLWCHWGVHHRTGLCQSDKQYILTFPNGYGRSLLIVPLVELEGEYHINCSIQATVRILFRTVNHSVGGKKHRIPAEDFFLLLGHLVWLQCDVFCFIIYIYIYCLVWLLSLRIRFFFSERQKGSRLGGERK